MLRQTKTLPPLTHRHCAGWRLAETACQLYIVTARVLSNVQSVTAPSKVALRAHAVIAHSRTARQSAYDRPSHSLHLHDRQKPHRMYCLLARDCYDAGKSWRDAQRPHRHVLHDQHRVLPVLQAAAVVLHDVAVEADQLQDRNLLLRNE